MDDSIERATYLKVSKEKIFYLYNSTQKLKVPHPVNYYNSTQKLKVPHPVNYFPGFLGRNIKNKYFEILFLAEFHLSYKIQLLIYEYKKKNSKIPSEN